MEVTYTVPAGNRRGRADKILAGAFPEHSRAALQRAFGQPLADCSKKSNRRAGKPTWIAGFMNQLCKNYAPTKKPRKDLSVLTMN